MKYHFGDLLDRSADYWTIVPNQERYAYNLNLDINDKDEVKILTISKYDDKWEQVFDCTNLKELTLHDPSKEQVQAIRKLTQLKRLRVTFFRAKDISFIGDLLNLEELVLEYVSGFSDLTPLLKLKKLKSLHLENLRRVTNFDGLSGLESLQYLYISGTVDWNQPIENFEFVKGLPNLEVFSLGFIINKTEYPALLPLLHLKKLKKIMVVRDTFKSNEFAFLQVAFPNVKGCDWDLFWEVGDRYTFLGKRAGYVSKHSPLLKEKFDKFKQTFEKLKDEAALLINSYTI